LAEGNLERKVEEARGNPGEEGQRHRVQKDRKRFEELRRRG